jgi:hypothetical protein
MKKNLLMALCMVSAMTVFAANPSSGAQSDATIFGLKGKVESAKTDKLGFSLVFDADGNIKDNFGLYDLITGRWTWNEIQKRTKTGFVANCDDFGDFSVVVTNNKITKMVFDHLKEGSKSTRTYTYDSKGNLSNVQEVYTYYTEEQMEYGANVYGVDEYNRELARLQQEYQRKLMNGTFLSAAAAQRWLENAERRLRDKLNGVGVNTYARTKKTKHTKTVKIKYSDYVTDDFGNWISRSYSMDEDGSQSEGVQQQTIKYESLFWSEFYWNKLEPEGDLDKIEAFFLNPNCHETYKKKASDYWNEHIFAKIDKNDIDGLCLVSKKEIMNDVNKEKAMNMLREYFYTNKVLPTRDFAQVANMKDMTYKDVAVFDNEYKNKITALSNKLRGDSIAFLTDMAKKAFDSKKYAAAERTSNALLKIDNGNGFAKNMCQEARYQLVLEKESNNTVEEDDYTGFLNQYAYSSHVDEIKNKRALYASSLFSAETPEQELHRVHNLQTTDAETEKIVDKRYKKWMFKKNHGRFFRVGFGGEFGAGGANTIAGGEVGVRLGYTAHVINGTIGVKYNFLTYTSQMFKKPKEAGKAFFERQYLSVPLMLRFNLKHGYYGSTYIGVGAELNVSNLSSRLRDVDDVKEKEFAKKTMSVSPRVAFGGYILGLEMELYATYDNNNHFNKEFIETYNVGGQPVKNVCEEKAFQKQVEVKDFLDKVHGGLAIRFWF